MSDFDNVGKLMHLPLNDVEPGEEISEAEFIITAAADAIQQSGGRNWIPVIVREIGDYQYRVVSNNFVYAVVRKAGLEKIWCIVIEPDPINIEGAKILAREAVPKINISVASRDTILAGLEYLIKEEGSVLNEISATKVADKIASANRKNWSSLNSITTLKCGITKGKKLDALAKLFYASAIKAIEPIAPPPEIVSIKRASRDDIFERLNYLSNYKIGGFEAVDPDRASDAIFTASKGKWKSLNPISKLECGIDTAKIKTLKTVFSL